MSANQPARPSPGRLEVICGPMFSGKSTELIRRLEEAREAGLDVSPVKPVLDDRYHPTDISTHVGGRLAGRVIHHPGELLQVSGDVVGLDEAHFFETGLHEAVMPMLERGQRLILAGLDRTSFNEPFGEMARLLIEADEVVKLSAPCAVCGQPAVHTIRLTDSKERLIIGGPEMFENRCRVHLHSPVPSRAPGSS